MWENNVMQSVQTLLTLGHFMSKYTSTNGSFLFQTDPNTAFLRAARAGQLDKIIEYLDSGTVRDINTSNAVSTVLLLVLLN